MMCDCWVNKSQSISLTSVFVVLVPLSLSSVTRSIENFCSSYTGRKYSIVHCQLAMRFDGFNSPHTHHLFVSFPSVNLILPPSLRPGNGVTIHLQKLWFSSLIFLFVYTVQYSNTPYLLLYLFQKCAKFFPSTSDRPVSKWVTAAGNCTVLSTVVFFIIISYICSHHSSYSHIRLIFYEVRIIEHNPEKIFRHSAGWPDALW